MKSTLGEFWNSKNVTSLWIDGNAIAGGKTYLQNLTDEGEYCDLHELIDNGLSIEPAWDLSGRVVEDGSWVWDGEADFRDVQGNSYYRMQVYATDPADSEADEYRAISIFMDGVFSGSGILEGNMEDGHTIRDCGAQFCDDADASEDVYGDIEEAINLGKKGIVVTLDGVKRSIVWSIVEPT